MSDTSPGERRLTGAGCGGAVTAAGDTDGRRGRLLRDFTDIIAIDSPSLKERRTADATREKLLAIGMSVYEDGAGRTCGGNCGNIIAALPGETGLPSVALLAHMDTVGPCENKRWAIDGDIIRSDGKTILGGDDAAGIAAAIEIVRRVKEEGIRHGGIAVILTIAEEVGLYGSKYLDPASIGTALGNGAPPEYCFVFDSGTPPGSVVSRAPSHTDFIITVTGAAAHAGIEPEKGVNAIIALSEAIAGMRLGRIDAETTSNIGVVRGGGARNVVCGLAEAEGEVRSHDPGKLAAQLAGIKERVAEACARRGAAFEFKEIDSYSAFSLTPGDAIIKLLSRAANARGYELELVPTGGGSDANVLNAKGVPAANLPVGMHEVHGVNEYTDLRETEETIALIVEALRVLSGD